MFSHLNKKTLIADIDPQANLTVADGAIDSHTNAVAMARDDFEKLAATIGEKIGVTAR